MFVRIGSKSINMQAIAAVRWKEKDECEVYLQGCAEPISFVGQFVAEFETAYSQLISLEQFVQQTQALMQQQQASIAQREQELQQQLAYVSTLKQEVESAAAQMHLKKNAGLIKPRG